MAFEAVLSQQRAAPGRSRRITLTFSVLVYGIALAAGVAHSIWQVEELPLPVIEVTLAVAAPPPPPSGIPGGVKGGIEGGTPPPFPTSTAPKILSERAGQRLLAINPLVRPYKVIVDEELLERQGSYTAVISICVAANGRVTGMEILKGTIAPIDSQLRRVVPAWTYRPYIFEGKAAPFCYPLRYTVR